MRTLIAGPSVYICDECVGLCVGIVAEESRGAGRIGVSFADRQLCDLCGARNNSGRSLAVRDRWRLCRTCTHAVRAAIWGTRGGYFK